MQNLYGAFSQEPTELKLRMMLDANTPALLHQE